MLAYSMLVSPTLAPPFHPPLPAPALRSPQLRPSSPPLQTFPPQVAPHHQDPLPQIRPFRMITIRIAPRVNPYGSQRYEMPYRTRHPPFRPQRAKKRMPFTFNHMRKFTSDIGTRRFNQPPRPVKPRSTPAVTPAVTPPASARSARPIPADPPPAAHPRPVPASVCSASDSLC